MAPFLEQRRNKQIVFIFIASIICILTILHLGKDSLFNLSQRGRAQIGRPAPEFSFPNLDGTTVRLSDYRGKVVFLNIWATWCPPCREEMPSMQKLYQELRNEPFEILAVSIDASGAKVVAPFMKEYNLTFPALLDPDGTIQKLYGTTGVPESYIINKQGIIDSIIIGPKDWATSDIVLYFRNLIQQP